MKTLPTLAALVVTASLLSADIPGRITTTDGRQISGNLRWQPAQRQYVVSYLQNNIPVTLSLAPAQVAEVRVQPPSGWEAAVRDVREGRPEQAVPRLEAIVREYSMLQYDLAAGQLLAQVHLRANRAAEALRVAESLIATRPDAGTSSDIAPVYWEALLATGRTAQLGPALDEAIRGDAPRPVAARAHTLRGDLLKAEGRTRDALKDGYLRTVTLFRDVRPAQPEALFKAAVAFEELQQIQHAERMRQILVTNFADSEYARRLRGN